MSAMSTNIDFLIDEDPRRHLGHYRNAPETPKVTGYPDTDRESYLEGKRAMAIEARELFGSDPQIKQWFQREIDRCVNELEEM